MRIKAEGVDEIVAAISMLKPGQEVTYCTSDGYAPLGIIGHIEEATVHKAALKAEGAGAMRFHRRISRNLHHHVIRGVTPGVKQKLEERLSEMV